MKKNGGRPTAAGSNSSKNVNDKPLERNQKKRTVSSEVNSNKTNTATPPSKPTVDKTSNTPSFSTGKKQAAFRKKTSATVTTATADKRGETPKARSVLTGAEAPQSAQTRTRKVNNVTTSQSASPSLPNKRKRQPSPEAPEGPPSKKMASSDDLLKAIAEVNKNVALMNTRLQSFCTKEDFASMAREVKSGVERNAAGIDKLHELRRQDNIRFDQRVEQIIDKKIAGEKSLSRGVLSLTQRESDQERDFLEARRSILVWPAPGEDLLRAAELFMAKTLMIPEAEIEGLEIEHVSRQRQSRRSRIKDELLIRFRKSNDRDVAQSYAPNLANVGSEAGLRMQIPDHLKGLFKQFEKHAAALKQKHPTLKRSIKFDDSCQSLAMDAKLSASKGWQRISGQDMRQITQIYAERNTLSHQKKPSTKDEEERQEVLMLTPDPVPELVVVEDEDDGNNKE